MAIRRPRLRDVIARLRKQYGPPARPPELGPFQYYLWDRVGYLFGDDKRRAAFDALRRRVGLEPADILRAKRSTLVEIAAMGGIEPEKRADHMREAAELVIGDYDSDLVGALRDDVTVARKVLRRFPMTADAGADRLLMFARIHPVLGLDSNGVRALRQFGFGEDHTDFAKLYRSVRDAITPELPADYDWLIDAHLLLQQHGRAANALRSRAPTSRAASPRRAPPR